MKPSATRELIRSRWLCTSVRLGGDNNRSWLRTDNASETPASNSKMNGSAIRVPIANVSVIDFGFTSERDTSTDEINALLSNAADGKLNGVLSVNNLPLVSIDFNHDPHSSIADLTQTHVMNKRLVRLLAWYDNEWGFSCRMLDNAAEIGKTLCSLRTLESN